jgi:UDP-N-acetylglucosamine 1-carboxyvinyltransferase
MYAIIKGGTRPKGSVRVSGAKNSATRLLSAALLTDDRVDLLNFPTELVDVAKKIRFCELLDAEFQIDNTHESVSICADKMSSKLLSREEFDVPIRTTYLLAAPQLVRSGIARIPYPGGCPIGGGTGGGRGYDQHILVWESLGAQVTERDDHIEISAQDGLVGGTIRFSISTVGGTENALLCAAIAKGVTQIYNAYITPEVVDLICMLRSMGADISVLGTSHITVLGKGGTLSGTRMSVMADRIEALTWIVYAILAKGEVIIDQVPFSAMEIPLIHLRHAGIDLRCNSHSIQVTPDCLTSGSIQPFEVACGTYPGIISDMQAFFVMLALGGSGTSRVFDYRYPERIAFVSELSKLLNGDHLEAEHGKITIHGPAQFISGVADSTDLRGSMAAIVAALCAEGESKILNAHMALRGYNNLSAKLAKLGCEISLHD